MRIIAKRVLVEYCAGNPNAKIPLERWHSLARQAAWKNMNDVREIFRGASALNAERIRFEIGGGNYRLIASVDFERQLLFIKFIGTHAEYDKIDALTVSKY